MKVDFDGGRCTSSDCGKPDIEVGLDGGTCESVHGRELATDCCFGGGGSASGVGLQLVTRFGFGRGSGASGDGLPLAIRIARNGIFFAAGRNAGRSNQKADHNIDGQWYTGHQKDHEMERQGR